MLNSPTVTPSLPRSMRRRLSPGPPVHTPMISWNEGIFGGARKALGGRQRRTGGEGLEGLRHDDGRCFLTPSPREDDRRLFFQRVELG